ncbi:MAG: methyltransferase domain-containing protein [Alphaproteobacteria bacterium]|nr:methyltransferase domain-containing protein [Alphaproteobacteria bacterium]
MDWAEYWNSDTPVYNERRQLDAYRRVLLEGLSPHLPGGSFTLLDWGCGDALIARDLAARGGRVLLWDVAERRRAALAERHRNDSGIVVLDEAKLAALETGGCDVALLASVLQYVPRDSLPTLLGHLRQLVRPGGVLVLTDIVPRGGSVTRDVGALLGFAAANGFLMGAVAGLVRTLTSDYRRLRRDIGLATWDRDELGALLTRHGWRMTALPANIGFDSNRWSALATACGDTGATTHADL